MASDQPQIIFMATVSCVNPETLEVEPVGNVAVTDLFQPFFIRSKNAPQGNASIRRTFFRNWERYSSGKAAVMDKSLSGLMGGFPLPGTMLDAKFTHIIGPNYGNRSEVERFMAVIRSRAVFSKNGLVIEHKPLANETSPRNTAIVERIKAAYAEHVGLTAEAVIKNKAQQGLSKEIDLLMQIREAISSHRDVGPDGQFAGVESYSDLIIDKSEGGQNLVLTDPDDYTKKIKIIPGQFHEELTQTEVLANRVTQAAGFAAPNAEIIRGSNGSGLAIRMDDYKIVGGVREGRQEYLLDFLGKPMSDVHKMTYQEMAIGLDDYERNLPSDLRDSARLVENKKAIFQWAMLNSATNNTDNHGRNLALLSDAEGRVTVAPFIDVTFDSTGRGMSTCLDGNPPIHNIDITNDFEVERLWDEVNPGVDSSEAFAIRDSLQSAILQIPDIANDIGIDLDSGVMDRALRSVSVQSFTLASELQIVLDEARLREQNRVADYDNSAGVSR